MKKAQLKINAQRIEAAYEKNSEAWAALHLIYSAIKNGENVPQWAILQSIKSASDATGAVGLDLANFLDDYHFGGEK